MLNVNNVVMVRLISGELVIGERDKDSPPQELRLKYPHLVLVQEEPNHQVKVGITPWIILRSPTPEYVPIQMSAVVFVVVPEEKLITHLKRAISPISLPEGRLITP